MPIDDALADIGAALSGPQPAMPSMAMPQTGVDAALADIGKSPEDLRAANAPPQKEGGMVRNLGAGGNEAIAGLAGMPVDAMNWLLNLRSGFANAANAGKRDIAPVPPIESPIGGSQSIESAMGLVGADPRDVGINNTADAVARRVGTGAVSMVSPYMAGRAAIAAGVDAGMPGAIARGVGGPAPGDAGIFRTGLGAAENAAIGGGAAVGGMGAASLLPEKSPYQPLADFAGQMLGGGLVAGGMAGAKSALNYGARQGRDLIGPAFSPSYREEITGQRLRDASGDPAALAQSLDAPNAPLVPGSLPTTFQFTGNQGIGQLERAQRTAKPSPFLERAGEQNAARVGAIGALTPESANAGAVRDLLQQHLTRLDTEGESNVNAAVQNARQAFEQAGGKLNAEDYGALIRDQLEAAKSATKRQESQLWQAIDPDEKLTINGVPVRETAQQIAGDIPKTAKPPDAEEKAVFSFASMLGTASPFQDFAALRGRLLQAIREERANGQTPALRRMQMLRSSMDNAISDTASRAAESDPALAARLGQEQSAFYGSGTAVAQASVGGVVGADALRNAEAGSQAVPGVSGTAGEAPSGFRNPAGNQGISPQLSTGSVVPNGGVTQAAPPLPSPPPVLPQPTWDAAAAARYRTAADATRQRAETFNNQLVGPTLAERGSEYRMLESRVPAQFLNSPEGIDAFIKAGGNAQTLGDALVSDLRRTATTAEGTLDPTKYASWQIRRDAALRAFPEVREALGDAASAQDVVNQQSAFARQQMLDFQRGAARHFLSAEPMQAVQSALASKNPVSDFRDLSRMVATDADAKAGLQRAVADYVSRNFVGNTEAGTSGVGGIKSDAFQTFLNRNDAALQNVFSPEQMQSMRDIAADLQRSNRSIAGSKIPGQSNTAQDLLAQGGRLSVLRQYFGPGAISGVAALGGYLMGGMHGAIEGALGAPAVRAAVNKLKATGLERTDQLLTEALLNPELARTLLMKASPGNRVFIAQRLGSQLGTLAGSSAADESLRTKH